MTFTVPGRSPLPPPGPLESAGSSPDASPLAAPALGAPLWGVPPLGAPLLAGPTSAHLPWEHLSWSSLAWTQHRQLTAARRRATSQRRATSRIPWRSGARHLRQAGARHLRLAGARIRPFPGTAPGLAPDDPPVVPVGSGPLGLAVDSAEDAGRSCRTAVSPTENGSSTGPEGRCDGLATPSEDSGRAGIPDTVTRGCGAVAGPAESSSRAPEDCPGLPPRCSDVEPGCPGPD